MYGACTLSLATKVPSLHSFIILYVLFINIYLLYKPIFFYHIVKWCKYIDILILDGALSWWSEIGSRPIAEDQSLWSVFDHTHGKESRAFRWGLSYSHYHGPSIKQKVLWILLWNHVCTCLPTKNSLTDDWSQILNLWRLWFQASDSHKWFKRAKQLLE